MRGIKDSIPKMIGYFLVKASQVNENNSKKIISKSKPYFFNSNKKE